MYVVVSETSPLRYLIDIGETDLLRKMYARVYVPSPVVSELSHAHTPAAVREWIAAPPNFIEIVALGQTSTVLPGNLGLGERAVIILAFKLNADLVLIDDRAAAAEAAKLGLRVTGTLGIFDQAAKDGLIDFASTVRRLQSTNFRVAPAVIDHLLREHAERRRR